MHKKFFRTIIFVEMTLSLGATPTIAMDDEEIPLTKHSMKVDTSKLPFGIDPADHYYRSMTSSDLNEQANHSTKKSSTVRPLYDGKKTQRTDLPMKNQNLMEIGNPKGSWEEHKTENTNLKKSNPKGSWEEHKIESTSLKKSIKHIEPGCCQSVQTIDYNSRWKPWKLDVPYYDISDYASGCGTFCSIFCCLLSPLFCCACETRGGCYFNDDDLMCFDTFHNYKNLKKTDTDGEGKVMTRRDALRVMAAENREMLEYYSNNPELRVDLYQPIKVNLTPGLQYQPSSHNLTLGYHASFVSDGPAVNLGRTEEIKEYERKLRAKGMQFVAHDLN